MSKRPGKIRTGVKRAVGALPAPRDKAALATGRAVRDLVLGREAPLPVVPKPVEPPKPVAPPPPPARYGMVVGPPLPAVAEKITDETPWVHPPVPETAEAGLVDLSDRRNPKRFDLALLEELNEEYRDKRTDPSPRDLSNAALAAAARRRVQWAHNMIDLRDKTVLEVGCGGGFEVWSIAQNLNSDGYGVDLHRQDSWAELEGERVHLSQADLTEQNIYPDNTFDRIVSYTVWEHVVHPHKLLEETYKILKPGGIQWIRANLWAGPLASHRYRDIYFPWPHLLFSDEVINEWDIKNGREPEGSWWVNKLSWNHYERYIHDIGYKLRVLNFQKAKWDEEFYQRFHDILGRLPRTDLERDFFTAVIEKPAI